MSINKDSQKAPNLRFKGFTDDWEQRRFMDLLDDTDGIRRGPFGSALKKDLFVSESDYVIYEQQNAIYDHFDTRYNISKEKFDELHSFKLETGDFIMSGAGTIGRISRVPKGIKPGVFNQALIRFRIKNEVTDSDYFLQWIRSDNMQRKFTNANPGSAMTNLVPLSEVKGWGVIVPLKEEQRLLGKFLTALDNNITLHQRKLDQLKQLKEALLQQMFPGKGETVPKLRFAGFEGDWEERKLGSIYDFSKGKGLPLDSFTHSKDDPAIAYGHLYTKYSEVISEVYLSSDDEGVLSKENDLLFPGSSTVPNGTAQANAIMLNNVKLGGDIIIARPKQDIRVLSIFMSYQINSQRQKLFPITVGTTIAHMYGKDLSKVKFFITNYSEQEKIGSLFEKLDNTISLQQRKLDQLQNMKQVLLQNMFI
ncbi:restriction endonuclease subunit S [Aerococcus urinaeequi]|uniref:restriction endonuclease subunit S n=1 Tax=Aerococcus urinaeequi TaxID=51665 RepID=UPI00288C76E1|nr:restriction endonuclease subunit S [Aerococcus urinaeequi]MDT2761516.1 restriction endonuclease subunit S [Aerococcus urinaeequi]